VDAFEDILDVDKCESIFEKKALPHARLGLSNSTTPGPNLACGCAFFVFVFWHVGNERALIGRLSGD